MGENTKKGVNKLKGQTIMLDGEAYNKLVNVGLTVGVTPTEIINSALDLYFAIIKLAHEGKELFVQETTDSGNKKLTKVQF